MQESWYYASRLIGRCRTINLRKNSQFYVRQGDVERLISQGYLLKLSWEVGNWSVPLNNRSTDTGCVFPSEAHWKIFQSIWCLSNKAYGLPQIETCIGGASLKLASYREVGFYSKRSAHDRYVGVVPWSQRSRLQYVGCPRDEGTHGNTTGMNFACRKYMMHFRMIGT